MMRRDISVQSSPEGKFIQKDMDRYLLLFLLTSGANGFPRLRTEVTEGTERPVDKRVQETIDLGVHDASFQPSHGLQNLQLIQ